MSKAKKELSPEILALIPDGIENFVPRCIVCTAPVPPSRARGRSKDTCSSLCHTVRQMYRKWVVQTSKCLACHHPSTPAERADFNEWRKLRGDLRRKSGRPAIEKSLDNANAVSPTPEIALCDAKQE